MAQRGERTRAISCGGIGAMHMLAKRVGLVDALDTRLTILKQRRPYSEADHVLNIAYNGLCPPVSEQLSPLLIT